MITELKPLFKWAGCKRKMFSKYAPLFEGLSFRTFVDLCGGTGITSVWIHKNFPDVNIILNEYNVDLYHIYFEIKHNFEHFIANVNKLEAEYMALPTKEERKAYYLQHRQSYHDTYHQTESKDKTPVLFFLMSTNFNGIWQAKASTGIYYTPFGNGNEKKGIYNRQAMQDFKEMVDVATIKYGSYEDVIIPMQSLVFADPPYVSSFTQYDRRESFEDIMQLQMAEYLKAHAKHSLVAFCNKEHEMFNQAFEGFTFEYFDVKYTASSKDTEGAKAKEILVHNFTWY